MADKYPRITIRVTDELRTACLAAGPERVRQALSILLSDKGQEVVRQPEQIVGQLSDKEPVSVPIVGQNAGELSDKTSGEQGVVRQKSEPAWKAKLEASRAKMGK